MPGIDDGDRAGMTLVEIELDDLTDGDRDPFRDRRKPERARRLTVGEGRSAEPPRDRS